MSAVAGRRSECHSAERPCLGPALPETAMDLDLPLELPLDVLLQNGLLIDALDDNDSPTRLLPGTEHSTKLALSQEARAYFKVVERKSAAPGVVNESRFRIVRQCRRDGCRDSWGTAHRMGRRSCITV